MKRGCLVCKGVSLVLALALVGVGYIFVVRGNVEPHPDGRSVVLLSADERNMVLGEMRGLLEAVQVVVQAASDGDMAEVSSAARAVGMVAAEGESASMLGKIPLDFMKMGMGTHKAFDALADTADSTDDPLVVLRELGGLMDRCTSCHAGYRFGIEGGDPEI